MGGGLFSPLLLTIRISGNCETYVGIRPPLEVHGLKLEVGVA